MTGILTALWRLANPVVGTLCGQRPPQMIAGYRFGGHRLGRCVLDPGRPGDAHMDSRGNTWATVEIEYDEEDDA
ncbi:hypothetical protein [Isoptericola sp. NPDC056605]|uniref:hypothetical protein n=1 Tax=Isoptericola sp. NPDC056605 TaxID=3345876 RepID=UPI003694D51F